MMMFDEKKFVESLQNMWVSELNTLWFEISAQQREAILEDDTYMDEICGRKLDLIDEQLERLDCTSDMFKE